MMMRKVNCLVLIFLFLFVSCATIEQRKIDRDAATVAATTWLQYFDEMNFEKLWEISADLLKLKTDKADFIRWVAGIRKPLGKCIERDYQVNDIVRLIEHYPDGEYRRIVYWSKYEHKNFVREYFLLIKEGDHWRVLRYDFI
jgi:hypothetical protein